jgi:hypothetical protein
MTPFMTFLQVNDSVIEKLNIGRSRMGFDFLREHRQKPYMRAALLQQSVTTVLIPLIGEIRTNDEFGRKTRGLLMDSCFGHARPPVLATLR